MSDSLQTAAAEQPSATATETSITIPSSRDGLAAILGSLDLPRAPAPGRRGRGRPKKNRGAIARSLVARALLDVPTITMLVRALHHDPYLRQVCGWHHPGEIPSCSTFCRLGPEIVSELPEQLRALAGRYYVDEPVADSVILPDSPAAPDVELAFPELRQLRDTFVELARYDKVDLSLRQLGVLLMCRLATEPKTVRSLSQELGLAPDALKHTLDRLDRLRLTKATRDPRTRRRHLVHRTRRSTEFLNALFASVARHQASPCASQHLERSAAGTAHAIPMPQKAIYVRTA